MFASRVRLVNIQARLQPAMQTIPAFGQVAVLALGGWLALHDHITLGTFFAFAPYMLLIAPPVRQLAAILTVGQLARAGAERIYDLLDSTPHVQDRPARSRSARRAGRGRVRPRDVRLHVDRAGAARLHAARRAGRDGRARRRFGFGQVDGRAAAPALLRRALRLRSRSTASTCATSRCSRCAAASAWCSRTRSSSPTRSPRTSRSAGPTRPRPRSRPRRAPRRRTSSSCSCPHGYDTVVGEQGLTLSGGQRQRVALARALLSDPEILLLDDATSSVDARIEEEIHATLRRIASTRTTLLIAHRRSTLSLADRIVVVDKGQVVDAGTNEELTGALPAVPAAAVRARATTPRASTRSRSRSSTTRAVDGITPAGVARPRRRRAAQRADRRPHAHDEPGRDAVRRPGRRRRRRRRCRRRRGAARSRRRPSCSRRSTRSNRPTPIRTSTSTFESAARARLHVPAVPAALPRLAVRRHVPRRARRGVHARRPVARAATASTTASRRTRRASCGSRPLVFLAITLFDWWVMWAEARVMGRISERLLHALRDQGVRAPAAARRRLLRERDGGPDHDPHDDRHRRAVAAAAERARQRAREPRHVRRRRHRARVHEPASSRSSPRSILPPLVVATLWFRIGSRRKAYEIARERMGAVNANLQEGLSGVRVSQAFVREERNQDNFEEIAAGYRDARVRAQRLVAIYFPFVDFLSDIAVCLVLGAGSVFVAHGSLVGRRAHRVPAVPQPVLRADPAAVAGVRLVPAGARRDRAHHRAARRRRRRSRRPRDPVPCRA